jgi:hypothetical protein
MCVLNGVMNVRVGGGFMNFEDFQTKYSLPPYTSTLSERGAKGIAIAMIALASYCDIIALAFSVDPRCVFECVGMCGERACGRPGVS